MFKQVDVASLGYSSPLDLASTSSCLLLLEGVAKNSREADEALLQQGGEEGEVVDEKGGGGGGGGGQLLRASTPNDISLTAQNVLARISPTIHPEPQTPFPRVPGHSSKCLQCENRRERICPRFTKCLQSRKCWERHGA